MIQLIGYQMWWVGQGVEITTADVEVAIPAARRRLGTLVIEPSPTTIAT